MVRRDPVFVAWAVGLGLAALIYLIGPDHFLFRLEDALQALGWRIGELIAALSSSALDVVRALAIGLFVTFLALAAAVVRRGGRGRLSAVIVSIVFVVLIEGASPGSSTRWVAALALSGVGAAVMTGRLRQGGLATQL